MLSRFLKNLSILKKFLFINFLVFLIIGLLTLIYLNRIQPTLIKTKTVNHINTLDNTIENLNRLQVQFNEEEVKSFLFSTRFLCIKITALVSGFVYSFGNFIYCFL